ncbi:MAG: tryptophan synthase subunit alpha [candidate division WS1 bacterium]|jgi:tryptophan synthase alpha chain|nr:tryptophan synthase subunit alpha [candidate division WS1 bacterium]
MKRIHDAFTDAPAPGALIIYLTAGDPTLDDTVEFALAAERGGADLIELGIPYVAPTADGPTIQEACKRALDAGATVRGVLSAARRIREQSQISLVTMTCFNPLIAYGLEDYARDAREAGIDGVLVSDLPPAEAGEWCEIAARHDLGTVFLVAPDNTDAQIRAALDVTTGFSYIISRPGTTGARADIYEGLRGLVERVKTMAQVPAAVGFGLSTGEQVAEVLQSADGAVVGSAVVSVIAEGGEDVPGRVEAKVRELRGG